MMFAAVIALVSAAAPAAAAPQPITGRWITTEGHAMIEIAPCGPNLCGNIVKYLKPVPAKGKDGKPVKAPPVGSPVFTGLAPSGDGWKGDIYTKDGKTRLTAHLRIDGGKLAVKGCWGLLCQTRYWTRAA